jgi:hypothetical protein
MFHYGGFFGCFVWLAILVVMGYPLWRIFEKLGYPGVASLLMYVPLVNLIALWYAALNPMPFEQRLYGQPPYGQPPYGQPPYGGSVPPPPPPPPPAHP